MRACPAADVPADAVTASASGLDPHISPAYARLQAAASRRRQRSRRSPSRAARRGGDRRSGPRLPRRAGGQRARAQPRARACGRTVETEHMASRTAARLPGRGARRGQDLRHARRGTPAGRARHRRGRRLRRDARPAADRRSARGARGGAAPSGRAPGHDPGGDGPRRRSSARRPTWCSSTSSPTPTCPAARTRSAGRTSRRCVDAGIEVVTTVNIQHLESLNDVTEAITGVRQRETVPDHVVRSADQIELVDMSPAVAAAADGPRQRLRRRRRSTPRCRATSARATSPPCASSPCCGSPTASTRAWSVIARSTTSTPRGRRASGSSCRSAEARSPRRCMRRAARIATRSSGGEWQALYVTRQDGLRGIAPDSLAAGSAPRPRSWAAPSTPSSATTPPMRSWPSRGPRTPPRSSSAPVAGADCRRCCDRESVSGSSPDRATSTSTSCPTTTPEAGRPAPRPRGPQRRPPPAPRGLGVRSSPCRSR